MSRPLIWLLWPLALLGFVAHWLDAALRIPFGGRQSAVPALWLLIGVLLLVALVPLSIEASVRQPQRLSVDDIRDGVSALTSWVRLSGRIQTISPPEEIEARRPVISMLVEPSGDAILLRSDRPITEYRTVTGELATTNQASRTVTVLAGEEALEGVDLIQHRMIFVDDQIVPENDVNWTLIWLALVAAGLLVIGVRAGYPVFVRISPAKNLRDRLIVGEPLSARIVDDRDQKGVRLLADRVTLVRASSPDEPGTDGLTIQRTGTSRRLTVYADRWLSATPGELLTLAAAIPALTVQSWGVNVLLAFANVRDRDRAAGVLRVAPR